MKKLVGVLFGFALAVFAVLPAEAYPPGYHYCERPMDCLDYLDCRVTGCVNHLCQYECWW